MRRSWFLGLGWGLGWGLGLAVPLAAWADPHVDAVAAGDATATSAVLWVRATDADKPARLRVQVSTDPDFRAPITDASIDTIAIDDFTAKLRLDHLAPGTRYHYRFCAAACDPSAAGQFNTAPLPDQPARVRFGFTGDSDGRFRPYPAASDIASRDLDFFIFLGDTIYETRATGSPAAATPGPRASVADAEKGLADYFRKYRETIQGVTAQGLATPTGPAGIAAMLRATGSYTVLDNHELGSRELAAGGAPPVARASNPEPDFDTNETGPFNNATIGYRVLEKAFYAYHPTRAGIDGTPGGGLTVAGPAVNAPADPRSDGTPLNWFAQSWGSRMIYIQTENRAYRDVRLGLAGGGDDIGPRADNPQRTMLGRTQLSWLKQTLLAAQQAGITWKFVILSSPMDQVGSGIPVAGSQWPAPGTQNQDGKSWDGGYRAERDDLLGFIADNGIGHVVFLTTDDHFVRVTPLQYRTKSGASAMVPGAIHIVSGPIGAGGPDVFPGHDCATIAAALERRLGTLAAMKQPPNGLAATFPGLTVTHRRCGAPGGPPAPIDFFIPDQFAYTTLQVDPDGLLTIETFGVDAYKENTFPQTVDRPARLMGFTIRP